MITQIYEVQAPKEAHQLIEIGVDHIGSVILSDTSWKNEDLKETMGLIADSRAKSSLIPLFGDPDAVCRVLDWYRPDMVHFCEIIVPEDVDGSSLDRLIRLQIRVREEFPEIRIMRSIPMAPPGNGHTYPSLEIARRMEPVSDFFLTDTLLTAPSGAVADDQPVDGFVGITGKICDWDLAAALVSESRIPVILAGGLTPDNAAKGIRHTRPAGVDSCTGTNAVDAAGKPVRFKKDMDKVRRFVAAARKAVSNDNQEE